MQTGRLRRALWQTESLSTPVSHERTFLLFRALTLPPLCVLDRLHLTRAIANIKRPECR